MLDTDIHENAVLHFGLLIVKIHYKNGENYTVTLRKLRKQFSVHNYPSQIMIKYLINKFEHMYFFKKKQVKRANVNI